ncbi:Transmembrane protein 231 [Nesidiocoris tenuis]|uniref:Transmembrane protein 231 n=1 Tax=Nesidiocoris tenuis TaxID=355587 RepID=A0ABN7AAI3_9HEMI|nr:Transmembrane protein 231 [Nesidiocoris tenuis]
MVLYVIFKDGVQTEYKTSICSKATLLILFINFLMFTIPFLIAYNTQGFWLKSNTYLEQPDVHFIYQYLVLMETDNIESPVICTTFQSLASHVEEYDNCPKIKAREEDYNKDGLYDKLFFEVEGAIGDNEVFEVTIILLFDYKLTSHSNFQMQSMGWLSMSSALGGGRLDAVGELRLEQKSPLGFKGRDLRYNVSVVTATHPHEYSLPKLLSEYSNRNVTTTINNVYSVWRRGRDSDDPFVFSLELSYPEQLVRYKPGTWQVLKMAWVQYLALLYVSFLIGRKLKHFVLDNRLVNNIRCHSWKKSF